LVNLLRRGHDVVSMTWDILL